MSNLIKKIFVSCETDKRLTVPEFYAEKSVLVTGFTGLLGKLVVEKLLWSCPNINKIYILIRSKRDLSPSERLKKITDLLAFDRIRETYPGIIESKLVAINGDLSLDDLGLTPDVKQTLCEKVNVVIHSAASVRFDDTLDVAVNMNMIGTKKLLELSLDMPNIQCFLHVSTAYSNCDNALIKEELYPAKINWKDMINVAEKIEPSTLQVLSQKFMDTIPNTYIFTKALTEHIVNDYKDNLPLAIVRPAVVVPAFEEPVPGWIDNKFGPLGINLGFITGIARCGLGDKQCFQNYVHSDFVINSIILAAYKKAVLEDGETDTPIYNACSPPSYKCTHEDYMLLHTYEPTEKYLNNEGINYFSFSFFKDPLCFWINFIFRHMISALLIDFLLTLSGKPALLIKIRRNLLLSYQRLRYFIDNSISFEVDNFMSLPNMLSLSDKNRFGYDFDKCNMAEVYHKALVLSPKVLLKPIYKHIDITRMVLKWMYIFDMAAVAVTYSTFTYFVYKFNILPTLCNSVINIFSTLN